MKDPIKVDYELIEKLFSQKVIIKTADDKDSKKGKTDEVGN